MDVLLFGLLDTPALGDSLSGAWAVGWRPLLFGFNLYLAWKRERGAMSEA